MKMKKKRALISWVMTVMILCNTFSTMSIAFAQDDITDAVVSTEQQEQQEEVAPEEEGDDADKTPNPGEEVDKNDPEPNPDVDEVTGDPGGDVGKAGADAPLGEPLDEPAVPKDVTKILENFEAKVTQDEIEIPENGTIDGTKDILVEFSFKVPVKGDGGPGPFVNKGDSAEFKLSDAFRIIDEDDIPLYFDGKHVATVSFTTNEETKTVIAHVVFDGDADVFTPSEGGSVNDVEAMFEATLRYKGHEGEDPWGNEDVFLLEKTFTVEVDTDEIAYKVVKDATELTAERKIRWSVEVEATKTVMVDGKPITKHIDLAGYTFVDTLKEVGGYVAGSFEISGVAPAPTPDYDIHDPDKVLSYPFETGMMSPKTITFETDIPDGKYFASGPQPITNTAELRDGELVVEHDSKTHTFTPPTWITKSGDPSGEYPDSENPGNYDPENRFITWTIEFNHAKNTLQGVKIIDALPDGLSFVSANWYKATGTDPETGADIWDSTPVKTWGSKPADDKYDAITEDNPTGTIDYKGRLVIVTKVDNEDETTTETTFTNSAAITWDNFPSETVGADEIEIEEGVGVTIGYTALTKTGERVGDSKDRKIEWTVTFDPKGQTMNDLKIYDLLVYNVNRSDNDFDITDSTQVTGVPAGITRSDLTPRYGQKYIIDTFTPVSGVTGASLEIIPIKKNGVQVADLLVITLPAAGVSKFTFQSQVVDPELFAKNTTNNSTKVYNTATLLQEDKKLTAATGDVDFNSSILAKEMLRRAEVPKDHVQINPNNSTTTASEGFHYQEKAAIFRLSVNADGLNWPSILNEVTGQPWGHVTVVDTLPEGWVFDTFSNGEKYLIYEAEIVDGVLKAKIPFTTLTDITGLMDEPDFGKTADQKQETVTFTFTNLDKPYVILVKAKPTTEKLTNYLTSAAERPVTETNRLRLTVPGWNGISTTRNVSVNLQALKKTSSTTGLPTGVVKWSVEYNPYGLIKGNKLEDTLPEGIDLRTDASGKLILEGNITAHEITMNAAGEYTTSTEVVLKQEEPNRNIWYDNQNRTLHFIIPNEENAYRLTYITDVTRTVEGAVYNQVRLSKENTGVIDNQAQFIIQKSHGEATMQRSGWLEINKKDAAGGNLGGATFTLYAKDSDTIIRQGTSGSNGVLQMMAIPVGEYRLIETDAPGGYLEDTSVHTVKVEKLPDNTIRTTVDGRTGSGTHKLTVTNYKPEDPVGSLRISKTVTGDNAETNKPFDFTVTFTNEPVPNAEYSYTGVGVPGGVIKSGDTISLAHGQSITITGLPADATYAVTEKDYTSEGYHSVSIGATDTVVSQRAHLASFTNTRNKPGQLTISKTVDGAVQEPGRKFEFTVTITTPVTPPAGGYTYKGHGGASDGTIVSGGKIYLADGESITIEGLPEDAEYKVEETDYSSEGYITQSAGAEEKIVSDVGRTAAFINHAPGSLTITKTVEGNVGDRTKKFDFTVTFEHEPTPDTVYSYTGVGVPNGFIKSGDTISLADGESITITGLPAGTGYQVEEASYAREGYVTTRTGATGTIPAGDERTTSFTNTKNYYPSDDPTGSLTIRKTVGGNLGDKEKKFTFVVTFNAGGLYSYSGSKSGMISSGQKILLGHDEHITIVGLPVGTTYEVVEEEANRDGYRTTSTGAVGTISHGGKTAEFTNTRGGVNPNTGDDASNGRAAFGVVAFSLLLTGLFGLDRYLSRKYRRREQN